MSEHLYRTRPYDSEAPGRVSRLTPEGGVVIDNSLFYPTGGGQPGDSGFLEWNGGRIAIASAVNGEAVKGEAGTVILIPAEAAALPPEGTEVVQRLDWDRRYRHMRVHTALHLLSVVVPLPVTGGQIGTDKGRLDFDMPEPPKDVAGLEWSLNALIARDLAVSSSWISDEDLAANPALIKTMSVAPPVGQGRVRLVRIGDGAEQVDLQPCGGTHVARTGEIGPVTIGRIENKGRQNRRITLVLGN